MIMHHEAECRTLKIILEVLGTEKRFFFRFFKGRCEILRERKMYGFYILEKREDEEVETEGGLKEG